MSKIIEEAGRACLLACLKIGRFLLLTKFLNFYKEEICRPTLYRENDSNYCLVRFARKR